MNHDPSRHGAEPRGFWRSRYSIGLIVMGTVAAYFLLAEHRTHFLGALPYLLVLACPLMHLFMHHGHGGHGGGHGHHAESQRPDTPAPPQPPPATREPR